MKLCTNNCTELTFGNLSHIRIVRQFGGIQRMRAEPLKYEKIFKQEEGNK